MESLVIVGASLAGLSAARAARNLGFAGRLVIIGDDPQRPYDRPPLSKQVLKGWVPAGNTKLPRLRAVDADWRLGVDASTATAPISRSSTPCGCSRRAPRTSPCVRPGVACA